MARDQYRKAPTVGSLSSDISASRPVPFEIRLRKPTFTEKKPSRQMAQSLLKLQLARCTLPAARNFPGLACSAQRPKSSRVRNPTWSDRAGSVPQSHLASPAISHQPAALTEATIDISTSTLSLSPFLTIKTFVLIIRVGIPQLNTHIRTLHTASSPICSHSPRQPRHSVSEPTHSSVSHPSQSRSCTIYMRSATLFTMMFSILGASRCNPRFA